MIFINLTPHDINLNNGKVYKVSGKLARVSSEVIMKEDGFYRQNFSEVVGLPDYKEGVYLIVSGIVLQAEKKRKDLVSPATSHPNCKRNSLGNIISVPGFVKNDN